ncbi:MAG: MFS transporter [bacterium]|nr:MFS transporter [bacterium]
MNLTSENKNWRTPLFIRCFYGYMVSGMMVLVFGSILPDMIKEAGLSYILAGGLLSAMAIGNFSASFLFPVLVKYIGKRASIIFVTALSPFLLFCITLLPPVWVMYVCLFLIGIGKGSITIFNNAIVNDYSKDPVKTLNYLHCSYAVGAFSAPMLTGILLVFGCNWRVILYFILCLGITSCLFYASKNYNALPSVTEDVSVTEDTPIMEDERAKENRHKKGTSAADMAHKGSRNSVNYKSAANSHAVFYKNFDFYCIALLLFFYTGLENCVNGWFVTYLQSMNIMSEALASIMVSVTWICIMAGRLTCAALSKKVARSLIVLCNCLGSAAGLFILITGSHMIQVVCGLILLGLFMSGIFPTSVAVARPFIKGSTNGMAFMTAISSIGGILAPQLVGMLADTFGISGGIALLLVNAVAMLLFSVIVQKRLFVKIE